MLWPWLLVLLISSTLIGALRTLLRATNISVFSRLERILKLPGSCLYVHCKSGRDRSAVTMFALLRLQFGLSSHDAWAALRFRVGRDKWPVAKVWDKHEILAWIDEILLK